MALDIKNAFLNAKNFIKDLVFPSHITCDFCNQDLFTKPKVPICEKCLENLPYIHNGCEKCGKPCPDGKCAICTNTTHYFKKAISVFDYKEPIMHLILNFKYNNQHYLCKSFAYFMYMRYLSTNWKIDVVIHTPMSPEKKLKRIHNQAELLANEFCKFINLPLCNDVIYRKNELSQTFLNREERYQNVLKNLNIKNTNKIKGKNVLLVDDILTTSATCNAISKKLMESGAKNIFVLTLCNVAPKSRYNKNFHKDRKQ